MYSNEPVCEECQRRLFFLPLFSCGLCGKRLPNMRCSSCGNKGYALFSIASYHGEIVRKLMHSLKYGGVKSVAEFFGNRIYSFFQKEIEKENIPLFENPLFIPIPLHKKKERERGFNQAELIARSFMKASGKSAPPETRILKKRIYTPSQTEQKNVGERIKNVKKSFSVEFPELIHGRDIFLFDDVHTSGATMHEAVRVLRQNGARNILALVFAKTRNP